MCLVAVLFNGQGHNTVKCGPFIVFSISGCGKIKTVASSVTFLIWTTTTNDSKCLLNQVLFTRVFTPSPSASSSHNLYLDIPYHHYRANDNLHLVSRISRYHRPGALATTTLSPQANLNSNPVCIGSGSDASSDGLLASILIPSFIGLLIWLLFAILRPRFRQLYGLREWFVEQGLRPKPLSSSLLAFLHPPGPAPGDAELFPADEQLSQRALWIALLIALGWALVGLGGALPLYMVSIPCIADFPSTATFGGSFSTLEDLSLMRLLRALDSGKYNVSTTNLLHTQARSLSIRADAGTNANGDPEHLRVRVIVLTVLVLVLALLPALYKIVKELNILIAYRKRWLALRCEGKQLGWLSARKAPGFTGVGVCRIGMGMGTGAAAMKERGGEQDQPNQEEKDALQVDITNIFSICDTQRLALLIDERDEILENLEIAETRGGDGKPYISHPQPLRNTSTRKPRRKRSLNPAFASSSLAPTSFVAPSLYYKLNRVQGVSGGQFGGEDAVAETDENKLTLSQTINSRLVGSRFQEVNRNSAFYGRLPLGSHVRVDQTGELGPIDEHGYTRIPDPQRFGPNHGIEEEEGVEGEGQDWVDVFREHHPRREDSVDNGPGPSSPSSPFSRRTRRNRDNTQSTSGTGTQTGTGTGSPLASPMDPQASTSTKRETFPFRRRKSSANATQSGTEEEMPPPHMRLQARQPFVRPHDNINFDHLGEVYSDITQWRSRLKAINAEIGEAQTTGYEDIAGGVRIRGWLLIGRGLRFINGVEIIEGMAKEDVRWDVLQNERGTLDSIVLWCLLGVAAILLAAGLTAAAGLSPDDCSRCCTLPTVFGAVVVLQDYWRYHCLRGGHCARACRCCDAVHFPRGGNNQFLSARPRLCLCIWHPALCLPGYPFNNAGAGGVDGRTESVANGAIYMAILALSVLFTCAIIFPGLLLLQPLRLWTVLRAEKSAVTPRQRFRAVYPRTYNPAFATGACILAIIFASTFSIIFPLVAPAVVILLLLSLVAHRFLVGYVYARTHSQTGGLLQIWLLRRFGTLLSLQPILLGLIFLSREFWIEGGVLCGTGLFVILFIEIYVIAKTRQPGRGSLSPITRDSLDAFRKTARPPMAKRRTVDDESTSMVSSARMGHRTRGSMASVLEMMSVTLAVMPPRRPEQVALPLKTETLDDLTATERAARTHPDAPPHLPPLSFTDHAREMASILYAPELIAPPPIIWLPNDAAGVARSEAVDLQKYHDLQVTLDVKSKDDIMLPLQRSVRGR
ncbi:MPN domain-containing protein [Mycena venus]|uniref:MPN domain-containing protein n=1 Tax=Mycena venus TaxID=2733690 RepID=A0A8H6U1M7_9AGAR|nr:MPN domain-containing protein [Mycena venus]